MIIEERVINHPGEGRTESLNRTGFLDRSHRSLLYVGAWEGSIERGNLPYLIDVGFTEVTILEIWEQNCKDIQLILPETKVIQGDIREFSMKSPAKYDVVVWWHGPEHVKQVELPALFDQMFEITGSTLILGCPYGNYPKGVALGNPFEEHISALEPEFFNNLGFNTDSLLLCDGSVIGSHITAWKSTR